MLESSIAQLVTLSQRGDAQAFCRLIRQFEKAALSTAYAVLADPGLAGDATQDAFLYAWHKLGNLREPDRFGAWLMQMVRNRAIDRRRRKPHHTLDPAMDASTAASSPADAMETEELHQRVDLALRSLDEITRHAVAMRYFENLSSKEIASRLDLSPAAVDMRLSRGRQQLREVLADLAVNES